MLLISGNAFKKLIDTFFGRDQPYFSKRLWRIAGLGVGCVQLKGRGVIVSSCGGNK